MSSWTEQVFEYAGDLDCAAQEVIAELDEQDGIVIGTKEYRLLIKQIAEACNVGKRDLDARVREYL